MAFVTKTGETVRSVEPDSLRGIGGSATVIGEITLPMKIGKSNIERVFKVANSLGV